MKLPTIPFLADAFLNVLRRFPFVMVAAAVGVITSMLLIENELHTNEEAFIRIILTCSLGLTSFLCASLVVEKWKLKQPLALIPHVAALGLMLLYYFTLEVDVNVDQVTTPVRFIGLNLAAHLGVAFLPYLDASSVEDFWEYNKRLFGNFMVGAFYSLVIFAGLSIAILAVNELFNLSIDGKIYGHLFIAIAGIFNTAYFLAHFPEQFDFSTASIENQAVEPSASPYTTSFKNLTKFILIPIVAIYFLILYAFSAKILVTWELPQGWVGKLVLGFSVAGIFTYLLNYLLVKYDDSIAVKGFRRWFFYILLPMVVLLFVAIGRRISDYGITEARYVVATAGVWLLLMSVYFIASKKDNIKFIPISLAFFSLITVLGPFSAFKASERNQLGRFMAILEKNNMLKDGKIIAPADTLSTKDAEQFRASFDYLRGNGHFEQISQLVGLPKDSVPDWEAADKLLQSLGVQQNFTGQPYCAVYFTNNNQAEISITGYDFLYQVYAYDKTKPSSDFSGFTISDGRTGLQYYKNGEKLDSFDLQPYLKMLQEKGMCEAPVRPDSLAVFEVSSASYYLKFHAENVSFESDGTWRAKEVNGKAMLRKKQ